MYAKRLFLAQQKGRGNLLRPVMQCSKTAKEAARLQGVELAQRIIDGTLSVEDEKELLRLGFEIHKPIEKDPVPLSLLSPLEEKKQRTIEIMKEKLDKIPKKVQVDLLKSVEKVIKYYADTYANKYKEREVGNLPISRKDLVIIAEFGAFQAMATFDSTKGVKFETYASHRIKGAIIDFLRGIDYASRRGVTREILKGQKELEKKCRN